MTKGRLAETIVEEMFISSGYDVHRFGMENMVPGLVRKLGNNNSYASSQIKRMPDFVMRKDDQVHFVEVKYKGEGFFDITDLEKDNKIYPYEECIIIVISRDKMKSLTVKDLRANKKITPFCENYLARQKEFSLEKGIVSDYLEIVKIFFSSIPPKLD